MKYHLSNRQAKEIDRGNMISLAVPAPDYAVDPMAYVREVLDIPARLIVDVDTVLIPVNPCVKASGLASVFGQILHDHDHAQFELTLQIECYVVQLAASGRVKSKYPHQWPGSVTLDNGRTLPEEP